PSDLLDFFFPAEDGIRAFHVTGVQTCALPISLAIDFSRTLDPTLSERLLRDFIGGARGVFVRRLLRLGYGEAEGKILGRYRDDRSEERRVGRGGRSGGHGAPHHGQPAIGTLSR